MPPNQQLPPTPNNQEIDQALKEFEAANAGKENISFDMPTYEASQPIGQIDNTPKIVKLVIKYSGGAIKDQRQAEWILLGFVVFMVSMSIYFAFFSGPKTPTITPAILEKMQHPTN